MNPMDYVDTMDYIDYFLEIYTYIRNYDENEYTAYICYYTYGKDLSPLATSEKFINTVFNINSNLLH